MKKILRLALLSAVAGSGAIATSANAVTLIVSSNGILTGATGVKIGTATYDVAFRAGTCAQVYGTCETSAFEFSDFSATRAAAQALLDQVFIDGPSGQFDSNPKLTFGCRLGDSCTSYIPSKSDSDFVFTSVAINKAGDDSTAVRYISPSFDTAAFGNSNYARFTLVPDSVTSAVPEPASWAMMIGGFGVVGGSMRRKRRVASTVKFA